jgi:RNA polymerase sigma factor (sigma-70 family)
MTIDNDSPDAFSPQGQYLPHDVLHREVRVIAQAALRRRPRSVGRALTLNDLISEGWIAADEAMSRFDPEKGEALHYVRAKVRRRLNDVLRREGHTASVSARTLHRAAAGELSEESQALVEASSPTRRVSIVPGNPEGPVAPGSMPQEWLPSRDEPTMEEIVAATEVRSIVHHHLDVLAETRPQQAEAVRLSFGIDGPALSRPEIADKLGTTVENVKKLRQRGLAALREQVAVIALWE